MTCRLADKNDEPTIRWFHSEMLVELQGYGHDISDNALNATYFWKNLFSNCIDIGNHAILIAETKDEENAGVIMVTPFLGWIIPAKRVAVDWGCYVLPEHRKKGVATMLRTKAFEIMRDNGFKAIVSKVMKSNVAGMKSYQKVGAEIVGYEMEIKL